MPSLRRHFLEPIREGILRKCGRAANRQVLNGLCQMGSGSDEKSAADRLELCLRDSLLPGINLQGQHQDCAAGERPGLTNGVRFQDFAHIARVQKMLVDALWIIWHYFKTGILLR